MAVRPLVLNRRGFALAEFLLAAGLFAFVGACLLPGFGGLRSYYYKLQAQQAAQQMAGDIAALQQFCFYDAEGGSRLEMNTAKDGYRVYRGGELFCKREFAASSGLYFKQHLNALKFSQEGAPNATYNYIILCRYDSGISEWLQVQPVTGRVVFK